MISINLIRTQFKAVEKALMTKGENIDINHILSLDKSHREIQSSLDEKRAERNRASEEIGQLKKAGKDAEKMILEMRWQGTQHQSRNFFCPSNGEMIVIPVSPVPDFIIRSVKIEIRCQLMQINHVGPHFVGNLPDGRTPLHQIGHESPILLKQSSSQWTH